MFMCVELMLNAVNLTFVTFAKALNDIGGQAIVFFTLVGRRGRGRGRARRSSWPSSGAVDGATADDVEPPARADDS